VPEVPDSLTLYMALPVPANRRFGGLVLESLEL
jgi:hypothetical protein